MTKSQRRFLSLGRFEILERRALLSATVTPNDPYYSQQWGLGAIDAPAAWAITKGSSAVIVADLEGTGVEITQPDLAANIWTNPAPNSDPDYPDALHGWNFDTNSPSFSPTTGHGTNIAGIIGAVTNNSLGVAGVDWNVQIMPLEASTVSGMANAVTFAVSHGAKVINISEAYNESPSAVPNDPLYQAIEQAESAGVVVVTAAGNGGNSYSTSEPGEDDATLDIYPADFGLPNMINVAAVDSSGNLASFSNYGASTVTLGAPGVNITTTDLSPGSNPYITWAAGTSFAAPFVSGVVALVAAQHPEYSALQLVQAVTEHTKPLASLSGKTITGGEVDAYDALEAGIPPLTQVNLSSAFNVVGITADNNTGPGNLDGSGSSFSSNLLGSSLVVNGLTYNLGQAGTSDAIKATGQTITLPSGQYESLRLLGTGVNGAQTGTFTVNYTDGTHATFTQTLNDWYQGASASGESVALSMAYRNTQGGQDTGPFYLYAYTFALDKTQVVQSITLPNDQNIAILAMDLGPAPLQVTSVSPTNGSWQSAMPNDGQVIVKFNHLLQNIIPNDPGIGFVGNTNAVTLTPYGANGTITASDIPVNGTLTYTVNADGTSQIAFTPSVPLSTNVYLISINQSLIDTSGQLLTDDNGKTGTEYDTFELRLAPITQAAPQIVNVTTYNNYTTVDNNQIYQFDALAVQFNKAMNFRDINTATVQLLQKESGTNTYTPIQITVAYNPGLMTAYIIPNVVLPSGSNWLYLISVSGSLDDDTQFPNAGNTLYVPGQAAGTPYYNSFELINSAVGAGTSPFEVVRSNGVTVTMPNTNSYWTAPVGYGTIDMTEPVDGTTLGAYSVTLIPQSGGLSAQAFDTADRPLNAVVAANPNTNQIIIVPTVPLGNDVYLYTLQAGMKSLSGDQFTDPYGLPVYATFQIAATADSNMLASTGTNTTSTSTSVTSSGGSTEGSSMSGPPDSSIGDLTRSNPTLYDATASTATPAIVANTIKLGTRRLATRPLRVNQSQQRFRSGFKTEPLFDQR